MKMVIHELPGRAASLRVAPNNDLVLSRACRRLGSAPITIIDGGSGPEVRGFRIGSGHASEGARE
jgi:hypothetical protein